jgi:hypothetical protein
MLCRRPIRIALAPAAILVVLAATPPRGIPVYTRDVAPILFRRCAACHRPGEFAPFSVLAYRDVSQHARSIARAVTTRSMPPWKPVPGYGHFENERRLTLKEIQTISAWAQGGAPEGDPRRLPPVPHFTQGWQLGSPDLVARIPEPYLVAAHSPDQYRCFVVPLSLKHDVYVRAVEFRPSNRKIAHHALIFADSSGSARQRAEQSGGSYSCFGTPGFLPSAALGGWSPGASPVRMPEGAALRLRAGSDLVFQVHFHSRGEDEREQSSIGLYFTGQAPDRAVMDVGLVSRDIDIPPGERAYKVRDHFEIPVNVHAAGIIPHAHYLCRDMKGWAMLPGGRKVWLLWIRDWDFNWQDQYRYARPVALPAGTRVFMEFTYDNSAANPHNPNFPPKRVKWGGGSADEMAGLHIQVIPDRMEDVPELGRALWGKIMRMVGGSFYRLKPEP